MKSVFASTPVRGAVLALSLTLAGCSALENSLGGDKIDYRNGGARKTSPLEVPPDLTPLARDGRYMPQAGIISASTIRQPGVVSPAASAAPSVAIDQLGDLRIARAGTQRWLISARSPEKLWPLVKAFWLNAGFTLDVDNAEAGILETNWAENRAKLPQDLIRQTLGGIIDGLYSTGQRDKYRTRLERSPQGTEIYITHQGLEEVYVGKDRDSGTTWAPAPADPSLETEMLTRMMVSLGASKEGAQAAVASATAAAGPAPKARVLAGQPAATLQVDDNAERAWRRVGLALDRSGFTVEDRDRAQGTYNVRYVDPKEAAKEAGFFSKLFGGKDPAANALSRYRVQVKADGNATLVTVLTLSGQPDNSANAQRIVSVLADELKF